MRNQWFIVPLNNGDFELELRCGHPDCGRYASVIYGQDAALDRAKFAVLEEAIPDGWACVDDAWLCGKHAPQEEVPATSAEVDPQMADLASTVVVTLTVDMGGNVKLVAGEHNDFPQPLSVTVAYDDGSSVDLVELGRVIGTAMRGITGAFKPVEP